MELKKIWNNTPAFVSGIVVLAALLLLILLVTVSYFWTHHVSCLKYIISASIGGTLAYRTLTNKKIVLDKDRVIVGKLRIVIRIASILLFVLSTSLTVSVLMQLYFTRK